MITSSALRVGRVKAVFGSSLLTVLVLLLSGCLRPAVEVPFPNDPRVVHGEWALDVLSYETGVQRMVYAADAQRLFIQRGDDQLVYDFDPAVGWVEVEDAVAASVNLRTFDPAIQAFVAVSEVAGSLRITTVPADGSARSRVEVSLPAGHTLEWFTRGSGNTFAYTRNADSVPHLTWWDSLTGERGGSRAVPAAVDGFRVSQNGCLLALWNMNLWQVVVIDTSAPQTNKLVRLGACRTNARIEGSEDGRWALFKGCNESWQIADLSDTNPVVNQIGIVRTQAIGFAAGSNEVVWLDEQGTVTAFDPVSRSKTELLRLRDGERFDSQWSPFMHVHVDRDNDLVAVSTARGVLRVEPLEGAVLGEALRAELPALLLDGGTLDATAEALTEPGDTYGFSGMFTLYGTGVSGDALSIEGRVSAHLLHTYRPGGISPAALVPRLYGTAKVGDLDSGEERFFLTFSSLSYNESVYEGLLIGLLTDERYVVKLQRAESSP